MDPPEPLAHPSLDLLVSRDHKASQVPREKKESRVSCLSTAPHPESLENKEPEAPEDLRENRGLQVSTVCLELQESLVSRGNRGPRGPGASKGSKAVMVTVCAVLPLR